VEIKPAPPGSGPSATDAVAALTASVIGEAGWT
jgi:hypothetical protein